jgi:hypothetical protein
LINIPVGTDGPEKGTVERLQDQGPLAVICAGEGLLQKAREVADRIEEQVWTAMGEHPSLRGPHAPADRAKQDDPLQASQGQAGNGAG